ncbi:MAG: hypothetical protein OES47_05175 [Acidobacteriota bacterium]|nr:hypothetical protein [Acidobacteriota bacterium]
MTDGDSFLRRLLAARRAAWQVLLVGVAIQMLTYFAYLVFTGGGFDGLIESGLYGDLPRQQLSIAFFAYVSALKLINFVVLLAAVFLTLWVRAIRGRQTPKSPSE